jgi:hypothetical protein
MTLGRRPRAQASNRQLFAGGLWLDFWLGLARALLNAFETHNFVKTVNPVTFLILKCG